MIKTIVCKKCERNIKIDFSKAPNDKFTIACPGCQQKYQLEKPKLVEDSKTSSGNIKSTNSDKIKTIPCPKCKSSLKVDFARIEKFPAIIQCRSCETKIKLNDPNVSKTSTTGNLDHLAKDKAKLTIDKSKIDPKNNWAYKLYYNTRKIKSINKATLIIYMAYLVRSITKTLTNVTIDTVNPQSFLKLQAETNVVSINAFNTVLNPILKENGISPKLTSWASNWFVKKISQRIILGLLKSKKVDMTLPFIKKYVENSNKENAAIKRIFTKEYSIYLYSIILTLIQIDTLRYIHGVFEFFLLEIFLILPVFLLLRYLEFFRTAKLYSGLFVYCFLYYAINPSYEYPILREALDKSSTIFENIFYLLLIVSFIGDILNRKNMQTIISNPEKPGKIFKPAISLGVFLVVLIGSYCYYYSRH